MPGAAPDPGLCPFGDEPHAKAPPHEHPYKVGPAGTRQCHCGSRQWVVYVHPLLPLSVTCARCKRKNWGANAYERGREDGPRRRHDAPDQAPF